MPSSQPHPPAAPPHSRSNSVLITRPTPTWTTDRRPSVTYDPPPLTINTKRRMSTNSIPPHTPSSLSGRRSSTAFTITSLPSLLTPLTGLVPLKESPPHKVALDTIPAVPAMPKPGILAHPEPVHAPIRSPKLGRVSYSKKSLMHRFIFSMKRVSLSSATSPARIDTAHSSLLPNDLASAPSDLSHVAVRVHMARGVPISPSSPSSLTHPNLPRSPHSYYVSPPSNGLTTLSQLLGLSKPSRIVVMFTLDELKVLPPVEDLSPYFGLLSPALVGLINIGNSCYMAAALQCLGSIDVLTNYLLSETPTKTNPYSDTKGTMVKAYVSLLREVTTGRASVNLHSFKRDLVRVAPQFDGYDQQDAQEFLRFLLDALSSDVCRVMYEPKFIVREADEDALPANEKSDVTWSKHLHTHGSIVADVFSGQLQSSIRCWACDSVFRSFDVFWDLSVAIPQAHTDSGSGPQISLLDCLNDFAKEEDLERNEWYHCPKCQKQQRTSRRLQVNRLPMVVVIHLKRFASFSAKLTTPILIPMDSVDLSPALTFTTSVRYRLVAVLEHAGSLSYGHYVASVNRGTDWYRMDDGQVTRIADPVWTAEHEWARSAYVLFYQQIIPWATDAHKTPVDGNGQVGVG